MIDQSIPPKHEGMIVTGLSQSMDMITFLAEDLLDKKSHIFVEHLALSLRELSYYVEKYFSDKLTDQHRLQMKGVKNIRDAICHRSSPQNLLNPHLYLSGGFNFKDDDIEVQYGKTKVMLKSGLVELFLEFRRIISDSNQFAFIERHPSWNIEEQKLEKTLKSISTNLNTKNVTAKMREKIKSW